MDRTLKRRGHAASTLALMCACMVCLLTALPAQAQPMPYTADWESLAQLPEPAWFADGKFGIMLHWGPYSVAGQRVGKLGPKGRFQLQNLYRRRGRYRELMVQEFGGAPPEFGYKDIIPLFKAEKFDPDAWAKLFKDAGARYVIPTAEHHDGFAMWDSDLTKWDAVDMGPHRDLIGDLAEAVRAQGMVFGVSYHRERHWGYFAKHKHKADTAPMGWVRQEIERVPQAAGLYGPFNLTDAFIADYVARWQELQRKYRPSMMWIDDIPVFYTDPGPMADRFKAACRQMIADYVNAAEGWDTPVYLNNKGRRHPNWPVGVGFREHDNMRMNRVSEQRWQCCATLGSSYLYKQAEDEADAYKSVTELVHLLVDVVAKNGNLLLNVGPRGDGTISENQQRRLRGIGDWMGANGEAIYGTRPWHTFGETNGDGDTTWFTTKGDVLYAISGAWPEGGLTIQSLAGWEPSSVRGIGLLGHGSVPWSVTEAGLVIQTPAQPVGAHAYVFRIECDRPVDQMPAPH